MLVSINTEVGGVTTDQKGRFYNFMRCLQVVATAAAGSTPVVNPVNTSGGTLNGSYNCITVLSNSEAGGWISGTSTNHTANTAYNASAGSIVVDLYQASGKSTYPYLRQTFGNFAYSFASSFTSYPRLQYYQGCTASNPASVAYSSGTDLYGQTTGFFIGAQMTTYQYGSLRVDETSDTIYIASTANYLIVTTKNSMMYFGLRTASGWELSKVDNPPWLGFGYGRGGNGNWAQGNGNHQEYVIAWGAGIKDDGTYPEVAKQWGIRNDYVAGSTVCAFTWMSYGGGQGWPQVGYSNVGNRDSYNYTKPIVNNGLRSNFYASSLYNYVIWEAPVTDPITGLTVPAAHPVVFTGFNPSQYTGIQGTAYGIYRGPNQSPTGLGNFMTASEYTINGESWIPIRTGDSASAVTQDVWFLRKA